MPDTQLIQRRKKPTVIQALENLDAFPKVPDEYEETTSYGGTASIFAVVLSLWLVILEINYYLDTDYKFHFSPDTDMDSKLSINVDIAVAMPCGIIGADIVDSTNQNVVKFGELEEEYIHFEMNDEQKAHFKAKSNFNSYLREEYHSLNKILWKNSFLNMNAEIPKLSRKESHQRGPKQSCRLFGKLELNKVAGNFHVTAGKTLPLPRGHAHIAAFMSERDYNFSHRIYKFSFGEETPTIVLPLEGDEKIANANQMVYHYFIQVVPTLVQTRFKSYQTYQYSVRELAREINHSNGSHGISGIFFKYEMSGLKVNVTEESESFLDFIIRLCAILGGVYATIGMLYNHLSFLGCTMKSFSGKPSKSNTLHFENKVSSTKDTHAGRNTNKSTANPILQSGSLSFQASGIDLVKPQPVEFLGASSKTNSSSSYHQGPSPTSQLQFSSSTLHHQRGGDGVPDIVSSHLNL